MRKLFSIALICIGLILVTNLFIINMTGNVINDYFEYGGSFLGLIFIIIGVVLFLASQKSGKGLEGRIKIISSKRFEKSIKKHPKEQIKRAVKKLGTGLANEEYLKDSKKWSLRVSKGGRIIYDRNPKEIILYEYVPSSHHSKYH